MPLDILEYDSTALDTGGDINFWIMDENTDVHDFAFFLAFGTLELSIAHDASHN